MGKPIGPSESRLTNAGRAAIGAVVLIIFTAIAIFFYQRTNSTAALRATEYAAWHEERQKELEELQILSNSIEDPNLREEAEVFIITLESTLGSTDVSTPLVTREKVTDQIEEISALFQTTYQ